MDVRPAVAVLQVDDEDHDGIDDDEAALQMEDQQAYAAQKQKQQQQQQQQKQVKSVTMAGGFEQGEQSVHAICTPSAHASTANQIPPTAHR